MADTAEDVRREADLMDAPEVHPHTRKALTYAREMLRNYAVLLEAQPELLRRLRAAEADAERWKYLESLQCNQFILSKNEDNASNYTTAKEWIEEFCPDDFTDTPEEEIQRMKETNTIWRLQIYPDTPIGFCVFFGATLQAAIDAARKP